MKSTLSTLIQQLTDYNTKLEDPNISYKDRLIYSREVNILLSEYLRHTTCGKEHPEYSGIHQYPGDAKWQEFRIEMARRGIMNNDDCILEWNKRAEDAAYAQRFAILLAQHGIIGEEAEKRMEEVRASHSTFKAALDAVRVEFSR